MRPSIILRIGITTASTKQLEKSVLGCENSEVEVLVVTVPKKLKKGKNLCLPRQHKTILHPVFPDATATTRTIMASRAIAAAPAENGSLSVIHPTVTIDPTNVTYIAVTGDTVSGTIVLFANAQDGSAMSQTIQNTGYVGVDQSQQATFFIGAGDNIDTLRTMPKGAGHHWLRTKGPVPALPA